VREVAEAEAAMIYIAAALLIIAFVLWTMREEWPE